MMKKIILLNFLILLIVSCVSQKVKKNEYNFILKDTYYLDSKIYKMNVFDSKKNIFELHFYKENNRQMGTYGNINPLIAKIDLDEKQLYDIYNYYKSLNLNKNAECINSGNVSYKSEIIFYSSPNKDSKCIEDETDKEKFMEVRGKINRIITQSSDYRKIFYWEFIEK